MDTKTQLYALIKRRSEYAHQHSGKPPFPIFIADDTVWGSYVVRGNDNHYRICDLTFYIKVNNGEFVKLS